LCSGNSGGQREHQHEERERRPHGFSIGRKTDAVQDS
jgi:hypothetical protein